MTGPVFGPQYDWSLPEDWREVGKVSEGALGHLQAFMRAPDGEEMSLQYLSDVVGAADLVLQIPTNLRGPSFAAFNDAMRRSSAPRLKKLSAAFGLVANPIDTVGKLLNFAATKLDHEDIDFVRIVAETARNEAILMQLSHCLEGGDGRTDSARFEAELGRAVYWYAFQEVEHWEIPPNLELTPDLANDAMKRHKATRQAEWSDPQFKFSLWVNSRHCKKPLEALGNRNFYIKKMSKGRKFANVERAWADYINSVEDRHKYVYLFAERSQWQRAARG